MGLLGVVAAISTVSTASTARAADPEPIELRQVARTLPTPDFTPSAAVGLRWDRDTEWTVLALTDPWDLRGEDTLLSAGPLAGLARMDVRENTWQATPYAATTVASAFAALATRGIPVFAEMRDFKTIRTHRLGCYFKGRGGGLVWRLEF
ncbi:MAG: hypothetical protein ACRBN8_18790 [Nannocystales bacterium]